LNKTFTKIFLLFLLAIAFPSVLFAQLPTPLWVNQLGGSGDSKCTGMQVDNQGNVYMCGYFRGTVDFDPTAGTKFFTAKGDADIYVAKFDPNGNLLWVSTMGGNALDQANSLALDKSGNVTVTGQFSSTDLDADPGPGVHTLSSHGAEDAFVIRLDSNGQFLWAKSFGSGGTDRGANVVSDSNGNVICNGYYDSSINVDGTILNSPGGSNGYIIKYNSAGNLVWALNLGSSGDDAYRGMNVDSHDNILVSGYYNGTVNFNPLGSSRTLTSSVDETFIAKYDPSGILVWADRISGTLYQTGSVICVDTNDNVYMAGAFQSGINFDPNNPGSEIFPAGNLSMFVAKYSPTGNFNFVKVMEGQSASAFCYQIASDSNNDIYITGYFSGTIDFNPDNQVAATVSDHGQRDLFLAKYDENGNYKWAFNAGNSSCDQTYGIELAIDAGKNILLGGAFCSTVDFDPSNCTTKDLTAINGICDSFIAKYSQNAPVPSEISSFSIPQESSPAVIDKLNALITVTVPFGTNIKNLAPVITVTNTGVLSPASGTAHDFTGPVD